VVDVAVTYRPDLAAPAGAERMQSLVAFGKTQV
jgi:hypothetical protein